MIRSFRNKGLAELWETDRTAKIDARFFARIMERLEVIDRADNILDLNVPGYDFHPLKRHKPIRYSIHVNGPWCLTFEFADADAFRVDFEQYH